MKKEQRKKVLLLGAGFSANFGAPLAKDVWLELFNTRLVQGNNELKKQLIENIVDCDFESFYHKVMTHQSFDNETKQSLVSEISSIYHRIDDTLAACINNPESNPNIPCINGLLGFLLGFSSAPVGVGKGLIFSLNQDILIERLCHEYIPKKYKNKGIWLLTPGCFEPFGTTYYDEQKVITIDGMYNHLRNHPVQDLIERSCDDLLLIKLHGSYNWRITQNVNEEAESLMVIGREKENRINQFPLLTTYMNIFRETMLDENIDLITIGYSFADPHINDIIKQSINEYGLKLFSLDIRPLDKWAQDTAKNLGLQEDKLWSCLAGYLNRPLYNYIKPELQNPLNLASNGFSNINHRNRSRSLVERFKWRANKLTDFMFD